MRTIERTGAFKRDYKREQAGRHRRLDERLTAIVRLLAEDQPLPAANRDHPLGGEWKGFRDCHIAPDLVLIYQKADDALRLVRLRSHSELFD